MTEEIWQRLKELAEKYENSSFLDSDPSQFLRWYKNQADVEIASFVAAMLSFGNRKQFIPKIRFIFETADKAGGIFLWIKNGLFEKDFCALSGDDEEKFYRFYSYKEMKNLLATKICSLLLTMLLLQLFSTQKNELRKEKTEPR